MMKRWFTSSIIISWMLCCVAISDAAQNQDIVAVITELKFNRGDIGVVNPGKTTAEKPAVLQSLYAGSRIQATGDASAVILFTDGMRTVKIDEKNSPFEVKPTAKGASGSGRLKEVSNLLLSKKTSPSLVGLTVRGKTRGPTLLTPRETKLLTATPRFQWMGSEGQPSTVKVFGPEGIIWSAENIAVTQAEYPASANDLRPGGQYSWSVERRSAAPEKASFMILSSADARAVQEVLAAIGGSDGLSKTTLAILRSSFLISRELYYDARETLLEAARADPEEPTLHFLLGEVYEKTGIKSLAQEE